jgi:chromatin segregation and condensation protein Rec8/ScpA/Scc1 (kleisin family)
MSKEVIIDPEWEEREREREDYTPPRRTERDEPEELDPFGVESRARTERLARKARRRDEQDEGPMVIELGAEDEDTAEDEFDEPFDEEGEECDEPPFDVDDDGPGAPEERGYDRNPRGGHQSLYEDPGRGYRPGPSGPEEDPFTRRDEDIPASKTKEYIGMLLSGSILTRTEVRRVYPYLLMIAFLMLLYISSLFRMQQLHRREIELTRQVKELRAVSLELSAQRMNATRRSFIMDEVERRGIPLQESLTAPKIIER